MTTMNPIMMNIVLKMTRFRWYIWGLEYDRIWIINFLIYAINSVYNSTYASNWNLRSVHKSYSPGTVLTPTNCIWLIRDIVLSTVAVGSEFKMFLMSFTVQVCGRHWATWSACSYGWKIKTLTSNHWVHFFFFFFIQLDGNIAQFYSHKSLTCSAGIVTLNRICATKNLKTGCFGPCLVVWRSPLISKQNCLDPTQKSFPKRIWPLYRPDASLAANFIIINYWVTLKNTASACGIHLCILFSLLVDSQDF